MHAQITVDILSTEVMQQELEEEEKQWEQYYMAHREILQAMARQALAEFEAGETTEIYGIHRL